MAAAGKAVTHREVVPVGCPHHVTYHRGSRAKAAKRLPIPPRTAQHGRPRDGWLYRLSACRAGGMEEGTDPGSG